PAEKVIFLGYPDGGLGKMNDAQVYTSPTTQVSAVPYSFAHHVGAPYTVDSVVSDLTRIIADFDPQTVYSTTPTDEHVDHAKTREFVARALKRAGGIRKHLEYLIHWERHVPSWPEQSTTWNPPLGHIPADFSIRLTDLLMSRD